MKFKSLSWSKRVSVFKGQIPMSRLHWTYRPLILPLRWWTNSQNRHQRIWYLGLAAVVEGALLLQWADLVWSAWAWAMGLCRGHSHPVCQWSRGKSSTSSLWKGETCSKGPDTGHTLPSRRNRTRVHFCRAIWCGGVSQWRVVSDPSICSKQGYPGHEGRRQWHTLFRRTQHCAIRGSGLGNTIGPWLFCTFLAPGVILENIKFWTSLKYFKIIIQLVC